jgi:PBSX family phage terminase large subunit
MIILGLFDDRNANAIVYRRVGNTIKDSVYAQMIWAIDTLGLGHAFKFKASPLEIIRIKTGQRIIFRGADDPMKSKSIKLQRGYFKYLWFEELAEFRGMEDIRTIKQSVLRGADNAFTLYSYNPPKSAQSWVNAEALKSVPGRLVHSSTYLDVPPEWLGAAFLHEADTLRQTNERAYLNEYMGEVTGTGGNVFENVQIRPVADEELGGLEYFYQGIDWGYFPDPFQWVRCGFDMRKRKLYIFDEYRCYRASNQASYAAIKDKLRPDEPLTADNAENKSIADFKGMGAHWIRPAIKGPGSVDYSMKWLAGLAEIVIDPDRCPTAAKEFMQYEFEMNREGEYVSGYVDADNHAIDAVRYALVPIWKVRGL